MSIESIAQEVVEELERAEAKFGPFNSSHEGYAVILEELDELWEVVKLNPKKIETAVPYTSDYRMTMQNSKRNDMMRAEAIQVAAMAMRFIKCICDQDKSDGQ